VFRPGAPVRSDIRDLFILDGIKVSVSRRRIPQVSETATDEVWSDTFASMHLMGFISYLSLEPILHEDRFELMVVAV
jgi:hypothetical protein